MTDIVQQAMESGRLSQAALACVLRVGTRTVRDWSQGRPVPGPAALALEAVIDELARTTIIPGPVRNAITHAREHHPDRRGRAGTTVAPEPCEACRRRSSRSSRSAGNVPRRRGRAAAE